MKRLGDLELFDQSRSLHLVDNFLLRLGLLDEVGVGTSGSDESVVYQYKIGKKRLDHVLLDVRDFLLLLVVRLHLIDLVLTLGPDIGGIVTSVVHHLFLGREIHDVRADAVHEILRMRGDDEDMVVRREVCFQPDDGAKIQMIRRLVHEEEMGLDEESAGEGDTHTPTTRHILGRLLHHRLRKSETVENTAGLCLERVRVHLIELLVCGVERKLVDAISDRELLNARLELRNFLLCRSDDEVERIDLSGFGLATNEVDIDVRGERDILFGDGL